MKIGIFVTFLPPHIGGIETVAENQIRALAAEGHSVRVVTSAYGTPSESQQDPHVVISRIPVWNWFEEKMGAVFPLFAPSLITASYRVVKESDIVHVHDGFYLTSLVAAFWCRVLRTPMVMTQHVDLVPHPSSLVMFVQKAVYATTGRFIFATSKRIVVLNSRVHDFLRSKNVPEAKITFLPNGIDTALYRPAENEREVTELRKKFRLPLNKTVTLFVGRFVPKKGFTKLQKLSVKPGSVLAFAGGDAPAGTARANHMYLGKVDHDEMPLLYRAVDRFILPSEGEGFPMTIQEAMASGLSVVTTNDPAYDLYRLSEREITLIEPTVSTLQSVLENDGLAKIGSHARSYAVKHFSLDVHAKRLAALYEEVRR